MGDEAMKFTEHLTEKLFRFFKKYERGNNIACLNDKKKLHLVLDLDNTLVHAIDVSQLSRKEKYLLEEADSRADLCRFNEGHSSEFIIKLRPFVLEFLQEANKLFSMSVYTMGTSDYAQAVLTLIDPTKLYFGDRVITREKSSHKKIDLVKSDKRRVVIVDDSLEVWPHHKRNLLEITEYMYFREDNMSKSSYAEQKRDESQSKGALANVLKFLKNLHKRFEDKSDYKDLRLVIRNPRSRRSCCF